MQILTTSLKHTVHQFIFPGGRCAAFILFVWVSLFSLSAQSQDTELSDYSRPEFKVYKSLSAALANPDSVYILDLSGKKLKEIPAGVFTLKNLQVLDLGRNKIKTVPAEITLLFQLIELDLSSNKFEEFPENVTRLKGLRKLSLNRNVIAVIPPSIASMESLQILELWDNEIGTLPDEMGQLRNLKMLELRGILFSEEQHQQFREMLPNTEIMLSPSCNCKTF